MFLLVLITLFNGCVSIQPITSEEIRVENSKDIVVLANRGRLVRFSGGDYSIVHLDGKEFIRGTGTLFLNEKMTETKPFSGDISFDDIQKIETREKKFLYYTGPMLFGSAVLLFLLAAFAIGVLPH